MQTGQVLQRAPVAAEQGLLRVQVERAGDRLALEFGHDQQHMLRHGLSQALEEFQVEIGRGVVLAVGAVIAARKKCPVALLDFIATQAPEGRARVGHLAPLLPDFLALFVRHLRQKFVERSVTRIAPVELHAGAQHHAGGLHQRRFLRLWKQHVQRRGILREFQRCAQQRGALGVGRRQEAWSGDRRERDGGEQLGVIREAVALIGVGPGPVEHILAIGMRLEINRHRRAKLRGNGSAGAIRRRFVPQCQELRQPAAVGAGAAAPMQGVEELI